MLTIKSTSKSFGEKRILTAVDLEIPPGETHALLGSSGSGKSTLLRVIMGILPADSGSITLSGVTLEVSGQLDWVRQIGYVPQDGGLFPHLTAEKNVTLVATTLNWSRDRIKSRIVELSKIVALAPELLRRLPSELSGGQRQRVALMRAVFLDPQLLLLDEPLAALDPISRFDVQSELKAIFHSLQKTVIFVTHDIGEAAYLGDRVTLLKDGEIVQSGPFVELVSHPKCSFVTRFINAQRVRVGE